MRTLSGTVLLISAVVGVIQGQAVYSFDDSADNYCGKTIKIHPDERIILKSSGRTSGGFCTGLIYALKKEEKNCHGMCMSVTSQSIDICLAKIQFKGMAFGKDDDPFKELSCFNRLPREWCFDTNSMIIEIAESHFYNEEMTKRSYNFSVEVNPICDESPFGKDIKARQDAKKEREDGARSRNRVEGILVGVCLAIMFLIILLITWCYYKNKPFRRDLHNYPTPHVHKGPSFAGFKAKITFNKGSHGEDGEAKPRKDKKCKSSKDEASTENEESKPKKRGGLRFLNKLRSNRAEEVPLVEKKDGNAKDVEGKTDEKCDENNADKQSDNVEEIQENEVEKTDEKVEEKNSDDKGEEIKSEEEPVTQEDVPAIKVEESEDTNEDP